VLPVAVWRKSWDGGKKFLILFLFHDISSNITQQLIKQSNALDLVNSAHQKSKNTAAQQTANSFVSVKL